MTSDRRSVLVTGASRGIGHATALRLAARGWSVYAGVRRAEDAGRLDALGLPGLHPLVLDVTKADDVGALSTALPLRLDAVVNNAGVVLIGAPMEATSPDRLREQLEVNVVGAWAVTRALLPRLRDSGGRVLFVSSVSGRVATPLTGAYNASKFALEGLTAALRLELRPLGVHVSVVAPAQTDTDVWRAADEALDREIAAMPEEVRAVYAQHLAGHRRTIRRSQRAAGSAEAVAAAVERALTAGRPRPRYVVGAVARVTEGMGRAVPTGLLDTVLSRGAGLGRSSTGS